MLEIDRTIDRRGELVDRGDAVLRVDEQPLPIERDDVDLERLPCRGRPGGRRAIRSSERYGSSRCVPIQVMAPRQMMIASGADQITSSSRSNGPNPGRISRRRWMPIAPGEQHRQRHHRQDDEQHQHCRDHDQVALLRCDVARRRHHHEVAAAQQCGQR